MLGINLTGGNDNMVEAKVHVLTLYPRISVFVIMFICLTQL